MDDLKLSKMSVDKITQYGLRPPELLRVVNMLGKYYRWFEILPGKIKTSELQYYISTNLYKSSWIDCLQRQIKLKKSALPEIMLWCDKRENEPHNEINVATIIKLFRSTQFFNLMMVEDTCYKVNKELDILMNFQNMF